MKKLIKEVIYQIHLWTGVLSGIFLFLICLSGTILTFEHEIHDFLNPKEHKIIDPLAPKKSIAQLSDELQEYGKVRNVTVGLDHEPYRFNIQTAPDDRRGKSFIVDPTNAEILNNPFYRNAFFGFNFRLHRWLLGTPESIGKQIVGISTIIFGLLLISGLYLWWPKTKRMLKQSLTINTKNPKKFLYDIHNTLGFYSLIPLIIMTLTGLCWSFEWYRSGLSSVLGAQVFSERRIEAVKINSSENKLDLETLIASVNERLNYDGSVSIQIENDPSKAYVVRKTSRSSIRYTDILQINPYDKTIISENLFRDKSFGAKIANSIRPLHTGEFFGLLGKIIYFITCFIATTLPITGTWLWLNKMKKKKRTI